MAKPNYAFEKRQKELAKKQKKQEKLQQRKASDSHEVDAEVADSESETEPAVEDATGFASTPTTH